MAIFAKDPGGLNLNLAIFFLIYTNLLRISVRKNPRQIHWSANVFCVPCSIKISAYLFGKIAQLRLNCHAIGRLSEYMAHRSVKEALII
jgi:hypothetical protein